jgi:hypothetical protein
LSPFDSAQGDPEVLEGSKDEPSLSWFDKLTARVERQFRLQRLI